MNCTLKYIENWLKANLNKERYEHSFGTAECAKLLAEKFCPEKIEKAYLAGLIHDCAKCLSKEETLSIIKNLPENLHLENGEIESPKTHHAPAGAVVANKEFGIEDDEILSAIRWHTIGKIGMSEFEKIIFIADKIEERTRPDEIKEPIKKVLTEKDGLNKALLVCYEGTIKSLVDRELRICTQTIDIYNELIKICCKI